MYEYKGIIHVHSKFSDGSASVKKIIKIAQDVGLDYVILTDHDTLRALQEGYEGWHENVLLLVGEELTPRKGNHYLAFDIKESISGKWFPPKYFAKKVAQEGGIGIIAHPHGGKSIFSRIRGEFWRDWSITHYTGLEIWSYMIDWVTDVTPFNALYYYMFPHKSITGPNPRTLEKWDEIAQTRHVVGIGSVDAHGKRVPILPFIKFLPYEYLFKTIRTHILTPVPLPLQPLNESRKLVYEGIRAGHCFIGYDLLADSTGFSFTGIVDETEPLLMGDTMEFNGKVFFRAFTPACAEIRLIRNGELIKIKYGKLLTFETNQPGAYRIEAYYDNKSWIFSNHIFLRSSKTEFL